MILMTDRSRAIISGFGEIETTVQDELDTQIIDNGNAR
jgi:hypothetical protein